MVANLPKHEEEPVFFTPKNPYLLSSGLIDVNNDINCSDYLHEHFLHHTRYFIYKSKVYPTTGHEGPEREQT
jgi:hypothetical protein